MVNANMEMKVTVELSEEDRKRIDDLTREMHKALAQMLFREPRPVPMPTWPGPVGPKIGEYPPFGPVWGSSQVTSDSTNQFTYND